MIHLFNPHSKPKKLQGKAPPMAEDFEFADAYYLDREDFSTDLQSAQDFVRFECKGGRFQ